ncbi:MAG: BrnA antitoxin family protein [Thermomicrobiales bacterium]
MLKSENIVSYTDEELREKRRREGTRTDWTRVDALTEEEIEASIDYEAEGHPMWETARMIYDPACKKQITLRLDPDIIEFFKAGGPGYQTRMNAVLRSYMLANAK